MGSAARTVQLLRHAAGRTLLATGLHPVAVVARRPSEDCASVADVHDLDRFIKQEWPRWGLGTSPRRVRWILLTGGPRSISKPVGLVFADDEATPRLAVKFARVPESSAPVQNEATILGTLAGRPGAANGIPHVVFADDRPQGAVVGETVVDGTPLGTVLRWSSADDLAGAGRRWLCDLAGERPSAVDSAAWRERLVDAPSREFARLHAGVVSEQELAEAERRITAIGGLPLVCEHRDFSPWNVLRARDGALRVLDWESAEDRGLPLRDLTYFLTYVGFFLEGAMRSGRYVETYRHLLDRDTRLGTLAARETAAYREALGIPAAAAHPLRLLTWMVHSFSEYRSLAADAGGAPSTERLRSGLFLTLWKEELARGATV
jgi:hypothetical protein